MISSLRERAAFIFFFSLSLDGDLDGVLLFFLFSFCNAFFRLLSLSLFFQLSQRFSRGKNTKKIFSLNSVQFLFHPLSISSVSPVFQTSAAGLETTEPLADSEDEEEEEGEREEEEPFPSPPPSFFPPSPPKHRAAKAATASATSAGFSS